jgi:hypothetical protein
MERIAPLTCVITAAIQRDASLHTHGDAAADTVTWITAELNLD